MFKKLIATVIAASLAIPAPAFADANNLTDKAGVTPDSIFYAGDKLIEYIELSIAADITEKAQLLKRISEERLAESKAMAEKEKLELAQKALEEYINTLNKAVESLNESIEAGKEVAKISEEMSSSSEAQKAEIEVIEQKLPENEQQKLAANIVDVDIKAQAACEVAKLVEQKCDKETGKGSKFVDKFIEEKIEDKAVLEIIKNADLNTRQIVALMSLSKQSGKPLAEVIKVFLEKEKGIGTTAIALGLQPKTALKEINRAFKDLKKQIKKAKKLELKIEDDAEKSECKTEAEEAQKDAKTEGTECKNETGKMVSASESHGKKANMDKKFEKFEKKLEKKIKKSEKQ